MKKINNFLWNLRMSYYQKQIIVFNNQLESGIISKLCHKLHVTLFKDKIIKLFKFK